MAFAISLSLFNVVLATIIGCCADSFLGLTDDAVDNLAAGINILSLAMMGVSVAFIDKVTYWVLVVLSAIILNMAVVLTQVTIKTVHDSCRRDEGDR